MALRHHNYGYQRVVDISYDEAVARVTETLKKEANWAAESIAYLKPLIASRQ